MASAVVRTNGAFMFDAAKFAERKFRGICDTDPLDEIGKKSASMGSDSSSPLFKSGLRDWCFLDKDPGPWLRFWLIRRVGSTWRRISHRKREYVVAVTLLRLQYAFLLYGHRIGTVFQIPLLLDHPYSIPNPTEAGIINREPGPNLPCWTIPSPDLHDGSNGLRSGATTKKCDMIVCCNAICGELPDSCEFRLHCKTSHQPSSNAPNPREIARTVLRPAATVRINRIFPTPHSPPT
ncbi:hypothetical protein C8J57DRAFT_1216357 [Mycena rebaudengoi]|nr:hypothetical protein C8J57DRAFT_1216357 [Mycena rebaudengoi]